MCHSRVRARHFRDLPLGIAAQCDLLGIHAAINAMAQVTIDGMKHAAVLASHSLLAPIPLSGRSSVCT
jgi:hypothetical protein